MPIEFTHKWYTENLLRANPEKYYVFGDNVARYGKGGQAIIRDEPNAIGVATKEHPAEFITSDNWGWAKPFVNGDLAIVERLLEEGKTVVFPLEFIGTGLADLPNKCPEAMFYIYHRVNLMMHKYGVSYEYND